MNKTDTYDEAFHFAFAQRAIRGDFERRGHEDDTKTVFSVLNVIPITAAQFLLPEGSIRDKLETLLAGRIVTMLFGLLVGWYVFRWSSELYGRSAGLFSLFLYVFSPNIIAHSRLVTTDLYAAGMYLISCYYFWRFLKQPTWPRATVSAVTVGLSQLAKCSCLLLYPIFFITGVLSLFLGRRNRDPIPTASPLRLVALYTLFFGCIGVFVINLGFAFTRTFRPLSSYRFRSDEFNNLQTSLAWWPSLPVPLPHSYVDGIDFAHFNEVTGFGFGSMYLLGQVHFSGGFPGYFFYCFLFKEPIALQILLVAALVLYLRKRSDFHFARDELVILTTVVCFSIYLNYFSAVHIGIRHFLPVIVLLIVFCGSLFSPVNGIEARRMLAWVSPLLLYLVVSVLSYHPHYISYFNETVWDRKMAYRYLADSNLDWSDNRLYLADYMRQHPEAVFEPTGRVTGKIVVSANALTGVWNGTRGSKEEMVEQFRWLREGFEPVDEIAYSYLVFDVPAQHD